MSEEKQWSDLPCSERAETKEGEKVCKVVSNKLGKLAKTNEYFCNLCIKNGGPDSADNIGLRTLNAYTKKNKKKEKLASLEDRFGEGPGTELHKMIPSFLERKECGCKAFAKKMNIWGVDGCEKRIETIVDRLMKESSKTPIFSWVPEAATRPVCFKMARTAIQRAREKQGLEKHNWFVAVTTAPRIEPTLQACLDSLLIGGWNPYIFAEPGAYDIEPAYKENMVVHEKRRGVWWNWVDSCRYALEHSDAEIIMTVQDDSLFHHDSKRMAEQFLWPAKDVGFVSLYTPKHYSIKNHLKSKPPRPEGLNKIVTKSLWGACALIWPRKVLEQVMQHELIEGWLGAPLRTKSAWKKKREERKKNPALVQNSDTAIGKIMNSMNRSMWFVDPSPVQHIAEHSAIGHGGNGGRRNCGRCAKYSLSLEKQVPLHINGLPQDLIDMDEIIL